MKKTMFSIFWVVFCQITTLYAQKQGNIWHFGKGAALDFNSGTALVTTPSSMWTYEGSTSICDENGNLLFYTNGGGRSPQVAGESTGKIWNRNHEVMYDMGFTEGGGFSAIQSSVIIPKPGAAGKYFLFTMEEIEFSVGGSVPGQPLGRGFSYFEVDMALNGGLGGVTNYTESVLVPSYEGLCVIRHSNGSDYWVLVNNGDNGLAVFRVDSNGVGIPQLFPFSNSGGSIKASPDGKWIAFNQSLVPFDPSSGFLGGALILPALITSIEFSSNSKRLFRIIEGPTLEFFDLTATDIVASRTTVTNLPYSDAGYGAMQLAPDGKIYFVQIPALDYIVNLSAIICPNSSPFVEHEVFRFDLGDYFWGLPNFDNALFRRDEDPPLPVNLGPAKQTLCSGQPLLLEPGISNAMSYAWSTGAQTTYITVSTPGTYTVTVTNATCGIGVDSVVVTTGVFPPAPNAGLDAEICPGASLSLLGNGVGTLLWSPASAVSNPSAPNPEFTSDESTILVLSATEDGCTSHDSVAITVLAPPILDVFPFSSTIQVGGAVELVAQSDAVAFEWSPAAGLSCIVCPAPVATPATTTTYFVTVTNNDGCTASASLTVEVITPDCTVEMPNAFTPNSDANNDVFAPVGAAIEAYNLRIFNRWGQEVYAGEAGWNGTLDQRAAPMDVYLYKINVQVCGTQFEFLGEVTLIR